MGKGGTPARHLSERRPGGSQDCFAYQAVSLPGPEPRGGEGHDYPRHEDYGPGEPDQPPVVVPELKLELWPSRPRDPGGA